MKPLIVLLAVFGLSLFVIYLVKHDWLFSLAGRIGMSTMLLFTAIGHFSFSKGMEMMLPSFVPFRKTLIILTGFIEIAAAIGLLLPGMYHTTGWWLVAFFLLILPANISAALRHVDYQKGNKEGSGPAYLWFRIPLQLFFIAWVYWFAIHR